MVGRRPIENVPSARVEDGDGGTCSVHDGLQRLLQLLPRVMRGLRRATAEVDSAASGPLGPRHVFALSLVQESPITVGALAAALGLTLPTASGVVADLEAVGFVSRSEDPADRRRTLVAVVPGRQAEVSRWLQGSSAPIARALEKLTPEERGAFVKGMTYLDTALGEDHSLKL